MAAVNLATIADAVYNRLASDGEGATIRASLGSGAAGVIRAPVLWARQPAYPFVVLRAGAVPTVERVAQAATFTWYIHDAREQGYSRITPLLTSIADAYATALPHPTGGTIGGVEVALVSQETEDRGLSTLVRFVQLAVYVI